MYVCANEWKEIDKVAAAMQCFFLSTTRSLSILPVTIAGHDSDTDDHGNQLVDNSNFISDDWYVFDSWQ